MTVLFFGGVGVDPEDDARRVDTPVGRDCSQCSEPIVAGDSGFLRPVWESGGSRLVPVHQECEALGIIGHVHGVCSCTGFDRSHASAVELLRRVRARGGELV